MGFKIKALLSREERKQRKRLKRIKQREKHIGSGEEPIEKINISDVTVGSLKEHWPRNAWQQTINSQITAFVFYFLLGAGLLILLFWLVFRQVSQ